MPSNTEFGDIPVAFWDAVRKARANQAPRRLTCCCCGESTLGRQWWNRDTGFGLCVTCIPLCGRKETPESFQELYGIRGVHYDVTS